MNERLQTGSCVAHDAKGIAYTIIEQTNFAEIVTSQGLGRVTGTKEYSTSGRKVRRVKKGEYLIVATSTTLTSTSPDAL